jgi:hypothetical protein
VDMDSPDAGFLLIIGGWWMKTWQRRNLPTNGSRASLWNLYDFFMSKRSFMQRAWLDKLTEAVRSKSYVLNRFNYWKTFSYK